MSEAAQLHITPPLENKVSKDECPAAAPGGSQQQDEADELQAACLIHVRDQHHTPASGDVSDSDDLPLGQQLQLL